MPGQRFHNQQQVAMPAISPCFWGTRFRCVCDAFHKFQGKRLKKQDASFHLCILQSHSPSQSSFNAQTQKKVTMRIRLSPGHEMVSFQHICFSTKERPAMLYSQELGSRLITEIVGILFF